MPQIITSQPVSISVKETYPAVFSVAVNLPEDVGPVPLPSPVRLDARITYEWQIRTPGIPGWQSLNRTVTKNTAIPSTWGGPTVSSVYADSITLKANQNRNGKFIQCVITYRVRVAGSVNNLSITTLRSSNATLTVTTRPHLFNLSSFNLIPDSDITYRNILVSAANRWNNLIKLPEYFIQEFPTYSGMNLVSYSGGYTDNSRVAGCRPIDFIGYPSTGQQQNPIFISNFALSTNTKYFIGSGTNYSAKDWENVMTHELGHALGIGSLSKYRIVIPYYVQGQYTTGRLPDLPRLSNIDYPQAVNAYNKIANNRPAGIRSSVPVENVGGVGNSGVHWQNNYTPFASIVVPITPTAAEVLPRPDFNGIVNELMVKTYSAGNPNKNFITDLSIGLLKDFGYEEVSPGARESGTVITDNGSIVQPQSISDHFCSTCANV